MTTTPVPEGEEPASADGLLQENGIDIGRLTEALNGSGATGTVTGIEASLVGTGQVGENVRCRLQWDTDRTEDNRADEGRPQSVVVKLASANEKSRAAAAATRTYIREVGFYRDVAASVAIRIPQVYALSEDRDNNRFVLIMEDIAPASAGNQLAGCTIDQAALGVSAAADLHGSTWGRTDLAELDWVDVPSPERSDDMAELFNALYPGFEATYADRLDDDHLSFGRWLAANLRRWADAREDARSVTCLTHGDYRLDNMLFGTGDPAPELTTVDWQTASLGDGLSDVAYFLSASLDAPTLREQEPDLLARYRDGLANHGVDLSEAVAWRAYRLSAPAGFIMAVIASQIVGRTDRGDDMFMVMAKGSATQALELETASLVG